MRKKLFVVAAISAALLVVSVGGAQAAGDPVGARPV